MYEYKNIEDPDKFLEYSNAHDLNNIFSSGKISSSRDAYGGAVGGIIGINSGSSSMSIYNVKNYKW